MIILTCVPHHSVPLWAMRRRGMHIIIFIMIFTAVRTHYTNVIRDPELFCQANLITVTTSEKSLRLRLPMMMMMTMELMRAFHRMAGWDLVNHLDRFSDSRDRSAIPSVSMIKEFLSLRNSVLYSHALDSIKNIQPFRNHAASNAAQPGPVHTSDVVPTDVKNFLSFSHTATSRKGFDLCFLFVCIIRLKVVQP